MSLKGTVHVPAASIRVFPVKSENDMRRTFLIVGAVILLLLIGVGIYFFVFNRPGGLSGTGGTQFPSGDVIPGDTTTDTTPNQGLGTTSGGAGTLLAPGFVRISEVPVALGSVAVFIPGIVPVATTSASTTPVEGSEPDVRIEYIERESGNMYGYQARARTLTRLTNKTLPGVQEVSWLSDGSLAYASFLVREAGSERINTYALPADGSEGYFLEPSLAQVLTRSTSTLVTLRSVSDGSSATISSPSGAGVRTLLSTPLSAIRLSTLGNNFVVSTKGASQADGYVFVLDAGTGQLTRVVGPLQGLSALGSPTGNYVLYSYLDRGKIALAVFDMTTKVATRLPLATLPEKCTWAANGSAVYCGVPTSITGTQPDEWYQGVSRFTDRLWKIDLSTRVATLLLDPAQVADIAVDAVSLSVDSTGRELLFTNRRDGLLYVYDL